MKRFILAACAGLLAAAAASPSLAADLARPSYKAPLYVAPFSWTGFYVGINGGYAWGKADLSSPTSNFTTNTQDGEMLGVTLGYNIQTGSWVWGLEGDVDYAWLKGNATNTVGTGCTGGGPCELKNTFFATARGRLGYSFDRFLPYVTGGAAFGDIKTSVAGVGSSNTTCPSLPAARPSAT